MYVKNTYAFFKKLKNNKTYDDISWNTDLISCNVGRKNVDFRKSVNIFRKTFHGIEAGQLFPCLVELVWKGPTRIPFWEQNITTEKLAYNNYFV